MESVYSLGEWVSPHRLPSVQALLWHAETDQEKGLYRCRSGYQPAGTDALHSDDEGPDFD